MRHAAAAALALLLPACVTGAAPPGQDTAQLLQDVRILSADDMQGRAAGTEGSAKARAYILQRFQEVGLRPLPGEGWTQAVPFTPREGGSGSLIAQNLIGYVPGRSRPERFLVISAHYDHLGVRNGQIHNGADDNASGVAALIALAEDFARSRPEHSVLFVAFDAEEQGHRGALGFVAAPPVPKASIVMNMNLDMVARGDRGELYVAGAHPYPQLRPHLEALAREAPVALKLGHDTPDLPKEQNWITQSDHFAFHQAGIPFAYFGVEDHPDYHQPSDDAEKIPQAFYGRAVQTLALAARRFDRELGSIADARSGAAQP